LPVRVDAVGQLINSLVSAAPINLKFLSLALKGSPMPHLCAPKGFKNAKDRIEADHMHKAEENTRGKDRTCSVSF
jgi:hypothetical protein